MSSGALAEEGNAPAGNRGYGWRTIPNCEALDDRHALRASRCEGDGCPLAWVPRTRARDLALRRRAAPLDDPADDATGPGKIGSTLGKA